MVSNEFRIGEVASQAGVSIDAVRYYERQRLLPPVARTKGGFRLFGSEAVERIKFIKHAQEIGLSLDEIKELLTVGGGENGCRRMSDLLSVKLKELDERIARMRDFRRTLAKHLAACERELSEKGQTAQCPVVGIK
jgi:DNA-binding transcriptional MerR regulator